jgi:parallel beta-helix repeat protein
VLRDCAANNNGGIGFSIGYRDLYDGSRLTDCSANQNAGAGFYLGYSAVVSGSTAVHNGGNGFDTSADGVITNCVADINQGDGFVLNGGQIEGCRAIINGASGTNHSGIHAFYGTNRIMNNTVQAGDLGIRVENLSGNFIVGNTVSNSLTSAAAFSFPIGTNNNTMGPILSSGPIPAGTTPLANWWRF